MPGLKSRSKQAAIADTAQARDATIASVLNKATEVIGNRDEAIRWMGTPVRALDYATPVSLLETSEGTARVENVLGQMEHGVW